MHLRGMRAAKKCRGYASYCLMQIVHVQRSNPGEPAALPCHRFELSNPAPKSWLRFERSRWERDRSWVRALLSSQWDEIELEIPLRR